MHIGPILEAAGEAQTFLERHGARYPGAREFALQRRVLLIKASNGTDLDISLGGLPFEKN